jgi:hypothetical protein
MIYIQPIVCEFKLLLIYIYIYIPKSLKSLYLNIINLSYKMQPTDVTMKVIPSHGTNIYICDTYMEKTQLLLQKRNTDL